MTDRDFCYWLRGYLELADHAGQHNECGADPVTLNAGQVVCIRKHLDLVFGVEELPKYERDEASIAHVVARRC